MLEKLYFCILKTNWFYLNLTVKMQTTILTCFIVYTLLLFLVMWLSSRRSSDNDAFFRGQRKSPWPVVAYGMIGASLSGVTFMSVPGGVYDGQFTYLPLVFGYVLGYVVIALVLLPLYYKLNVTSIYSYLNQRFGCVSERTGSWFFILSRLIGSAMRMYLVVFVLYEFVFKDWGFPFWVIGAIFVFIILLYTFRGGLKTVVWTDMLQTTFLLLSAIVTVVLMTKELNFSLSDLWDRSSQMGLTRVFETDVTNSKFYVKQILSGMFITIAMTGLDQDMMQKNLTCKSLKDAQRNVLVSSFLYIIVNVLFLMLGAALLVYAQTTSFPLPVDEAGQVVNDKIFPSIAFHFSDITAILFILGMVSAGYSSADGTLTALTTTFCFNILDFGHRDTESAHNIKVRRIVHVTFALLYLLVIVAFRPFHNQSLIDTLFDVAGFTYGPLLGMFVFGMFTKRKVRDAWVPLVALLSPVLCYLLKVFGPSLLGGYQFGFEILLINGMLTFMGLFLLSSASEGEKDKGEVSL